VVLLGEDNMPLFIKRGRKFGLTSSSLGIEDFKTTAIDTDLASVSANDDTFASAKAIKAYVDSANTLVELTDTTIASQADNNHLQYDSSNSKWVNRAFIDFDKISEPASPDAEEGRLYVKQVDASNNALAVKIKKATSVVEVELTSPGAVCGECGSEDGAKDPIFNFQTGTIIVALYCGHTYEMDIPAWRRI
jgi:hypothetical protein